jgi:uncharacterized protein
MLPEDQSEPPEGHESDFGGVPGEGPPNPPNWDETLIRPSDSGGGPEERPPARSLEEREVKVLNVFQEANGEHIFVLLRDGRGRILPILIGMDQAQAISIALHKEGNPIHRPLTHDLLKNIIEKLGARVERLTIDDMWQDTFYARLVLNVSGKIIDIDCRPTDGIAVALRTQAPIYVAEEVMESCRLPEE